MTDSPAPDPRLARARVIRGLREAADYLDQHPGVPVSAHGWALLCFPARDGDAAGRARVDQVVADLGVTPRDDGDSGHYRAVRAFGPVTYEFVHIPAARQAAYAALMTYTGAVTPAA